MAIAVSGATDPVGIVPIARVETTIAAPAPTATVGVLVRTERRPVSEAIGLAATGPTGRRSAVRGPARTAAAPAAEAPEAGQGPPQCGSHGTARSTAGDRRQSTPGRIPAVRQAVNEQNAAPRAEGKEEIPAAGLLKMAEELLPRLRVAEWLDRADAAKADLEDLDLRDLRSVVAAADDPMVTRDETARELANELKAALVTKQEKASQEWLEDIGLALGVGRVIRALKLSSEPPKAGMRFPADLAEQLATAATAALTIEATADRWSAVLEAVAFSPIRTHVTPAAPPTTGSDELTATVTRLAPLIPQIAAVFGITAAPGAPVPKPQRAPRKPDRKPGAGADGAGTRGAGSGTGPRPPARLARDQPSKRGRPKPAEPKPAEPKPAEPKPAEMKPSDQPAVEPAAETDAVPAQADDLSPAPAPTSEPVETSAVAEAEAPIETAVETAAASETASQTGVEPAEASTPDEPITPDETTTSDETTTPDEWTTSDETTDEANTDPAVSIATSDAADESPTDVQPASAPTETATESEPASPQAADSDAATEVATPDETTDALDSTGAAAAGHTTDATDATDASPDEDQPAPSSPADSS